MGKVHVSRIQSCVFDMHTSGILALGHLQHSESLQSGAVHIFALDVPPTVSIVRFGIKNNTKLLQLDSQRFTCDG